MYQTQLLDPRENHMLFDESNRRDGVTSIEGQSLDRAASVEAITIQTPQLVKAVELITTLIQRSGVLCDPGGLRIIGAPGAGKTLIRDLMIANYPRSVGPDKQPIVPILSIEMMPAPTVSQIALRMLKTLGDQFDNHRNSNERTLILKEFIRRAGVLIIFIDEFQHTVEGGRNKSANTIADWLKSLYDEVKIPIVFFGTPVSTKLFQISEQLASRIPGEYELRALRFDAEFISILASFNQNMPIQIHAEDFKKLAKAICKSTVGSLRLLKKLLKEAVIVASNREATSLIGADFKLAYDRIICHGQNPFEELV